MKEKVSRQIGSVPVFQKIQEYLVSCFLLTIPVLVWDLLLSKELPAVYQPETFWKDIPVAIAYGEHISRTLLFASLLLMPLMIKTPLQKQGFLIYLGGILLYYSSWLLLICFPDSAWSQSMAGFMAPAYTPMFWLAGIAFIGDRFYFRFAYTQHIYISVALLFLAFHNLHTFLVYVGTLAEINRLPS